MMRRLGKALTDCDGVGFGQAFYAHQRRAAGGGGGPLMRRMWISICLEAGRAHD